MLDDTDNNLSTIETTNGCAPLSEYEIPIADHYKLNAKKKLGSGAFGEIYYGQDTITNESLAIKLESVNNKHPQLFHEFKVYNALRGGDGIPKIYWCGKQGVYIILIIDLLGKSLEELFNSCERKFSLKTSTLIAMQMIERVEYMHSKNFIHRDIKPDNFLIGLNNKERTIYIIDFGLAKMYRDAKGEHIPYRDGKPLTGTARYASINTHLGIEQSRRDDLESVGYVLVYFLGGELPWQGIKVKRFEEKYKKIMDKKISTSVESLCKGFPIEIQSFIEYTRQLKFDETPKYSYMKEILMSMAKKERIEFDYDYDWNRKQMERKGRKEKEGNNNVYINNNNKNVKAIINRRGETKEDNNNNQNEDKKKETQKEFPISN